MNSDSISIYEQFAENFLEHRDGSPVGINVAKQWASSLNQGSDVIEIACGGGLPVTKTLIEAKLNVWAIDSSPTLVSKFNDRFPHISVECNSVLECDFFDRKFDAAISIGLIFLLDEDAQIKMIKRVSEVLHTGGNFLFTAPLETETWEDICTGHTCISLGQEAYENALTDSGFRILDHHEDSGKNHYYEAKKIS